MLAEAGLCTAKIEGPSLHVLVPSTSMPSASRLASSGSVLPSGCPSSMSLNAYRYLMAQKMTLQLLQICSKLCGIQSSSASMLSAAGAFRWTVKSHSVFPQC